MSYCLAKKSLAISVLAAMVSLPTVVSYGQNLWASLTAKPMSRTIVQPEHKAQQHALLSTDPNSEIVTVLSYQQGDAAANGDAATVTTTAQTRAYGSDTDLFEKSATYTKKATQDLYSGNTLRQYHGKGNQDTLDMAYNGLGQVSFQQNTETALDGTTHITHITRQQIIRTLKGDTMTVAVVQLDNPINSAATTCSIADNTCYTSYTKSSPSETRKWDNFPAHATSEQAPAQVTYTNDLGQQYKTDALLQADGRYAKQQVKQFDASGRVVSATTSIPLTASFRDASDTANSVNQRGLISGATLQTQTVNKTYDDVANTISSTQTGKLLDSTGNELSSITLATSVQTFNEQQQVSSESAAGIIVSTLNYDNLGQKTSQSTQALSRRNASELSLHETSNYNALGVQSHVTIGEDNANGAEPINVDFYHNDLVNGKTITSKTVKQGDKSVTRYAYLEGSQGETLAKYRGDLNNPIQQTYEYKDGGYQVIQHGWSGAGLFADTVTVTTTSDYLDIDNKRQLVQQVVADDQGNKTTTTFNYDYKKGVIASIVKKSTGNPDSTETFTYRADGVLLSKTYDHNKTVRYQYWSMADAKAGHGVLSEVGKLRRKIDVSGVKTFYYYEGTSLYQADLQTPDGHMVASIIHFSDAIGEVGRVLRESFHGGKETPVDTVIYTRDAKLRRTIDVLYQDAMTSEGDSRMGEMTYAYNDTTNKITEKVEIPRSGSSEKTITTDYTYKPNSGQLLTSTVTSADGANPLADSTPMQTTYERDLIGNQTGVTKASVGASLFGHANMTPDNSFVYSDDGSADGVNNFDRYQGVGGAEKSGITYDLHGNLLTDGEGGQFKWDQNNKLDQFTDSAGNKTDYYTPLFGRVKTQTYNNPDHSKTTTEFDYYYEGNKLSSMIVKQGDNAGDYVAYVGGSVRAVFNKNGSVAQVQYRQADATGTSTGNLAVDGAGHVVNAKRYEYSDNGDQRVTDGRKVASNKLNVFYQPLRFNGDFHEQESNSTDPKAKSVGGMDYKMARELKRWQSGVAQFMSHDFGYKLMSWRLLDNGDGVNGRDAGGHKTSPWMQTVGDIVGIGSGTVGVGIGIGILIFSGGGEVLMDGIEAVGKQLNSTLSETREAVGNGVNSAKRMVEGWRDERANAARIAAIKKAGYCEFDADSYRVRLEEIMNSPEESASAFSDSEIATRSATKDAPLGGGVFNYLNNGGELERFELKGFSGEISQSSKEQYEAAIARILHTDAKTDLTLQKIEQAEEDASGNNPDCGVMVKSSHRTIKRNYLARKWLYEYLKAYIPRVAGMA